MLLLVLSLVLICVDYVNFRNVLISLIDIDTVRSVRPSKSSEWLLVFNNVYSDVIA